MLYVVIKDMQPTVFKALQNFIYTDSLPDFGDLVDIIGHLLVAADWYAIDRLKLIYQDILYKNLDVEYGAITFALADQHSCEKLKDACIQFITSADRMDARLCKSRRSQSSVLVDVFEKTRRFEQSIDSQF